MRTARRRRAGGGRTRRARLRALAAAGLVVVGAWGGGLIWFAEGLPERVADPVTRTDAIVVLTGGAKRLRTGLDLLEEGRAEKLFVSGVHRGVDVAELLRVAQKAPEEIACCIDVGYDARDTIGNAAETARWMAAQGFRSLRLVTANYHLPRSLLAFTRAMPDVTVIPHPVFPPQVQTDAWWRRPATAWLVIAEYNKYIVMGLRHGLSAAFATDP